MSFITTGSPTDLHHHELKRSGSVETTALFLITALAARAIIAGPGRAGPERATQAVRGPSGPLLATCKQIARVAGMRWASPG